jgi:hypothetical protein
LTVGGTSDLVDNATDNEITLSTCCRVRYGFHSSVSVNLARIECDGLEVVGKSGKSFQESKNEPLGEYCIPSEDTKGVHQGTLPYQLHNSRNLKP